MCLILKNHLIEFEEIDVVLWVLSSEMKVVPDSSKRTIVGMTPSGNIVGDGRLRQIDLFCKSSLRYIKLGKHGEKPGSKIIHPNISSSQSLNKSYESTVFQHLLLLDKKT